MMARGEITFDIGNNKALANVGPNGVLKTLTIYRESYRACCNPNMGWPGVWVGKDNSSYGAYDAPQQTLRFAPQTVIGDFAWTDYPLGADRFSLSYRQGVATFKNSSGHPVLFEATVPSPNTDSQLSVNGQLIPDAIHVKYLDQDVISAAIKVPADAIVSLAIQP